MRLTKLCRDRIIYWLFPKRFTRKEKIKTFVVFAGALFIGLYLPSRIIITLTDSVKHRIFWLADVTPEGINKGDYLLFDHDHPWKDKYRGVTKIVKEVGCVGGDILTRTGTEYFCNGVSMGKLISTDSAGHQLLQFSFHGVVPAGKFFMRGHDVKSYDSKYFGFITHECVIAKAIPLF